MNRRAERPLSAVLGWRLPDWLLDVAPVAFVVAVGAAAVLVGRGGHPTRALALAGVCVGAGALLVRHRAPLVVLGVAVVLALVVGYGPVVILPMLLATFTVAEHVVDRRALIVAGAVAAGALVAADALHGTPLTVPAVVTRLIAVGLAVAVGLYLRARADYIDGLRERAERLERERELLAQRAVDDERVRIARELHDVVAHNVSLMVVEAQALAATGARAGADGEALGRVAGLGRDALSEMHRMLGVLRVRNGDGPELAPQPGVGDLPGLIEGARRAGLDAVLTVEGAARDLPAAVDLSVYRIVQEALTNVIRHARATHAAVTLAYAGDAVEVTVLDDGVGPGDDGAGAGGHGLVGMRERVALFGGRLETERPPQGDGYRVRALIPVR